MTSLFYKIGKLLIRLFPYEECCWTERLKEAGKTAGSHRCVRSKGHKGLHKCHCGEKFGKEG